MVTIRLPGMIRCSPGLLRQRVLGSSLECDIALRARLVSRRHVELWQEDDAIHFRDLGSTNGTFLDETPSTEGVLLPGSCLRVGEAAIQSLDTATALASAPRLPDTMRLISLAVLETRREPHESQPNSRHITMEDVAPWWLPSLLRESRPGVGVKLRFLRESLGCEGVVCYDQAGGRVRPESWRWSFPFERWDLVWQNRWRPCLRWGLSNY